jgi:hypothetical protein
LQVKLEAIEIKLPRVGVTIAGVPPVELSHFNVVVLLLFSPETNDADLSTLQFVKLILSGGVLPSEQVVVAVKLALEPMVAICELGTAETKHVG